MRRWAADAHTREVVGVTVPTNAVVTGDAFDVLAAWPAARRAER